MSEKWTHKVSYSTDMSPTTIFYWLYRPSASRGALVPGGGCTRGSGVGWVPGGGYTGVLPAYPPGPIYYIF